MLAISSDKTLTEINVPWIFRLPQGTTTASAVHMLKEAVVKVGADPEKIRDLLSSGVSVSGMAFLPTGELAQRQ